MTRVVDWLQDTGTAIVVGKKGQYVWTDGQDELHLSRGVYDTYTGTNLRYSQVGSMFSPMNRCTHTTCFVFTQE